MMEFNIRELKDKDIIRGIKVVYSSFGRKITGNIIEEKRNWKKLLENGFGKFLISEVHGKIFGIGGVFIFKDVCSFGYMAVLPNYRDRGVGTLIFDNLYEIAINLGCRKMMLYASKLGEPIYKKFGFQGTYNSSMYHLPRVFPKLRNINKKVKVLKQLPNWLLDLDKNATGFDRAEYLKLKLALGSKILAINNEAYGIISKVLSNLRLGPLISTNLDAALKIIEKSIILRTSEIIIMEHKKLPNKLFDLIKMIKVENTSNLRMTFGNKILENLDSLYAISTFAKG